MYFSSYFHLKIKFSIFAFAYIIDAGYFVDMQTSFTRYICFVNSICSRFAQTRYDINLVAARRHVECFSTYRVIYDISKISQEIYIDEKKTCRNKSFFLERKTRYGALLLLPTAACRSRQNLRAPDFAIPKAYRGFWLASTNSARSHLGFFFSIKKRTNQQIGPFWSGRRDSNSRRSPWQGDALPLSHSRIYFVF